MIRINVHDAKSNLSRYLERVEQGEVVLICRRNVPVAELRPLPRKRSRRRPLGLAHGTCQMAPDFDVLPDELVAAFEGRGS